MITESRRTIVRAVSWLALAVGMMLILNGTHSAGEAIEQFTLSVSSSVLFFGGIGLVLASLVTIAVLYRSNGN